MRYYRVLFSGLLMIVFFACKPQKSGKQSPIIEPDVVVNSDYTIAFGSCDNQRLENKLWRPIIENNPNVWIWGGDNVYADTENMAVLREDYQTQLDTEGYIELKTTAKVLGTWDDHDYGLNDGGVEFSVKRESQKEFLDFLEVDKNDPRREREGIYHAELLSVPKGSIKIIVLDTRYFRTALTRAMSLKKRYQPNTYGEGTVLGSLQWHWLEAELKSSTADFNIIVSSIQFLSNEHGYETWGNFPHEVDRLNALIAESKAKGVLLLSGDRHISEFSKIELKDLDYPLIDFTSSGLTHAYTSFKDEPNPYRVGNVITEVSFGLLKFDFESRKITMEMRGEDNRLLQRISQAY